MSSDMLDVHRCAVAGHNVIYHEFLLAYKPARKEVYGFAEGKEDLMYYTGLIENRLPAEWKVRLFAAGNRDRVLAVHYLFDWGRFDASRICFFVDRDLSEFLDTDLPSPGNLYVTECYSIENHIATSETLVRILKEIYGLVDLSIEEEQVIIEEHERNLEVFSEELVVIMAQILLWRRQKLPACLDNIDMADLFGFSGVRLFAKQRYGSRDPKLAYISAVTRQDRSSAELLDCAEMEFRQRDGKRLYIRGKFLTWLFVEFCKLVHADSAKYCSRVSKPAKMRIAFGRANAMPVLASRARMPNSLASFVNTHYLKVVAKLDSELHLTFG
jgi:hypothetical protein